MAIVERVVILLQRFGVLAVGGAYAPDTGYAQRNQITIGLGAVTLEIAVQTSLAFGHGQGIIRQSEMVHANIDVAGGHERSQGP